MDNFASDFLTALITGVKKPVQLFENQKPHADMIVERFTKPYKGRQYYTFGDFSEMGEGKSIVALYVAQKLEEFYGEPVTLFVVAPSSTLGPVWNLQPMEYGVPVMFAETYQKFSGTVNGVNHPYLRNYEDEDGKTRKTYTSELVDLVQNRLVLFIFDEAQAGKNAGTQTQEAIAAVANLLYKLPNPKSRMIIASGTPRDKPEKVSGTARMLGMMENPKYYNWDLVSRSYTLLGIKELYRNAARMDPVKALEIYKGDDYINKNTKQTVAYDLFMDIIAPVLTNDMKPGEKKAKQYRFDGEFYVPIFTRKELRNAIDHLKGAVSWVKTSETSGEVTLSNFGEIQMALMEIEYATLPIIYYQTRRILEQAPYNKVVIFVHFLDSLAWLNQAFKAKGVELVTMQGSDSREARFNAQQQFTYGEARVIIGTEIMAKGISLISPKIIEEGGFATYTLISPADYRYDDLVQKIKRTYRANSLVDSFVFIVYGDRRQVGELTPVINSMIAKAGEIKNQKKHKDVEMPGEYATYREYEVLPDEEPEWD